MAFQYGAGDARLTDELCRRRKAVCGDCRGQRCVQFRVAVKAKPISKSTLVRRRIMNSPVSRRTFAVRFASLLSALGIVSAASPKAALAQASASQGGIRKLNAEGKPGSEKDIIMPVIVNNGLIYVSGQGAHDPRDAKEWTIESHTTMVMDKIKKLVEVGGGTADTILQANVFLVK